MIKVKQRAYRERIETILYPPPLLTTGDLEPATRVISRTTEAVGLALADYSATLTLPSPPDARVAIRRIAARLNIQGTVIGTPTTRCRVYVDAQAPANMLFDSTIGASLNFLEAVDTSPHELASLFALLSDGLPHTFFFFLWNPAHVAGTHQYTVTVAQLWQRLGSNSTGAPQPFLHIRHSGFASLQARMHVVGTGPASVFLIPSEARPFNTLMEGQWQINSSAVLLDGHFLATRGAVATDLNALTVLELVLRSEQ